MNDMIAPNTPAAPAEIGGMIVRRVTVIRTRTPQQVLDATQRTQYTDRDVVATMPGGGTETEEIDVYFFKLGRVSAADLAKEYELRGLKPDVYAQAAVNEVDPAFGDETPNGVQWQDADGNYCFAVFDRRDVGVYRDSGWHHGWAYGGVRK